MIKALFILIASIGFLISARSQQTGIRFFGTESQEAFSISSVHLDEEIILVGFREEVGNRSYTRLSAFDNHLENLWQSDLLPTANYQEEVIIRHGDKYVFAGYDGQRIYLFHYQLDGTPIRVDTIASEQYPELLVSHLVLFSDEYVVSGQSIDVDGVFKSLIFRVSFDGEVTDIMVDSLSVDINGMEVDPEGYLTVLRFWNTGYIDPSDSMTIPAEQYSFTKYDTAFQVVWEYLPPPCLDYPTLVGDMAINPSNGNIVSVMNEERTTWYEEEFTQRLVMISPTGEHLWEQVWEPFPEDRILTDYRVRNLTFMPNGNVVLAGLRQYRELRYYYGWVACYSPDGEVLWDKDYMSNRLLDIPHQPLGRAIFLDVVVLNDTTILVGGNTRRSRYYVDSLDRYAEDQDGWLLILNEHGCIVGTCDDQLVTSTSDYTPPVLEVEELQVSPNPSSGMVSLSEPLTGSYAIYDNVGQLLQSGYLEDTQWLDLSDIPSGMVSIMIRDTKKQRMRVARVVVE